MTEKSKNSENEKIWISLKIDKKYIACILKPLWPLIKILNPPKKGPFTLSRVQKSPKRCGNIFRDRFWMLGMSQTLKMYTPYYCVCSYLTFPVFFFKFPLCHMVSRMSRKKFRQNSSDFCTLKIIKVSNYEFLSFWYEVKWVIGCNKYTFY